MDTNTFAKTLMEAIDREYIAKYSQNQTNRDLFLFEAKMVASELILDGNLSFDLVSGLRVVNIGDTLAELVSTAYVNQAWEFVAEAARSDKGAPLVIRCIRAKDTDLFYWSVKYFVDQGSHDTVAKLFGMLIEGDFCDTLEQVLVSLWQCNTRDHTLPKESPGCIFENVDDEYVSALPGLIDVHEQLVKKAIEYFRENPRECIQYVVTLWALQINDWKLAADILKAGSVKYIGGGEDAFMRALKDKAYDCCVLLMHSMMGVCENCDWGITDDLEDQLIAYYDSNPGCFESLFQASQRLNLPAAGGMIAVWLSKMEFLTNILNDLHKGPDDNATFGMLKCLLQVDDSGRLMDWLNEASEIALPPRMAMWLITRLSWFCELDQVAAAAPLVEAVMSRCFDGCTLDEVLVMISRPHLHHCLRKFASRGHLKHCSSTIRELVLKTLIKRSMLKNVDVHYETGDHTILVFYVDCNTLHHKQMDCENLQRCIEGGLLDPVNPFSELFETSNLEIHIDLPQIYNLYETGVLNPNGLWDLLEGINSEMITVPEGQEKPCKDFLLEVTRSPRTLLNSCQLIVSRALGYGSGRELRAQKLGLPNILVRKVLFQQD